jgi:hypothetical protein
MSTSENKIDKLFAQKLDSHAIAPRAQAWEKLNNKMKEKEKRILPYWGKLAVAASLALLIGFGLVAYFNNAYNTHNTKANEAQKKGELKKEVINTEKPQETLAASKPIIDKSLNEKTKIILPAKHIENKQLAASNKPNFARNSKEYQTENAIAYEIETPKNVKEAQIEQPKQATELAIYKTEKEVKPAENLTIVVTLANFDNKTIEENKDLNSIKKEKFFSKLFKQLKNAKNGDPVEWNEIGFKPAKILARAETRLKPSKEDSNLNQENTKVKSIY